MTGPTWLEIADAVWLASLARSDHDALPGAAEPRAAAPPPGDLPRERPEASEPAPGTSAFAAPPVTPRRPARREELYTVTDAEDAGHHAMLAALPDSRALARVLQPFKRRVISATETEPDEEATAESAADAGLWLPRYRPVPARWLSLVMIVDDSPSMAVWRPTATALRLLLERHGSFRSVRTFRLTDAGDPTGAPRLRGPTGGERNPAELLDPTGRQVFIVLSDGAGALWRNPRTDRLLRLWGRSGPLVIINPYPQGYWHRSLFLPRRGRLRAPRPVAPNQALRVQFPGEFDTLEEPPATGALPVPIIELDARFLRWWVDLVTDPTDWVDGVVYWADPSTPTEPPTPPDTETPAQRVVRFHVAASPSAFRLATYFAAAPLELPLLRRIQQRMLPRSAPHHLAEVMTSDLVRRTDGRVLTFEFTEGVREALLACATREDSAKVVRLIAIHHRHRSGAAFALTRAIEAPDLAPYQPVTAETLPMARIELAVLDALSGPYAQRANRLRHAIAAAQPGGDNQEAPSGEPSRAQKKGGEVMATQPDPSRFDDEPAEAAGISGHPDNDLSPPGNNLLSEDDPLLSLQELLDGQSQETGPTVWGNVPTRNPVFTGRRALLEQLERRLRTQSVAAVLPQALHGEGGVGKSQIAIEYAYRHRTDYDVVWWVPSERPAQILASLIELGNRLGLDVGNEVITAVPRVRAALRAGIPYSNWLLVFDNAETPETVRDYFPDAGTGKVLVTSRNQEWSRVAETLEVDVFARPESIRLLQRRNPELTDAEADRLAEVLGDLPLAIEHASAWLAATDMAVGEYLDLLAEKRAELTALVPTPGYEMPVAAAANVAIDRLATENPAALQLLQVCSFFAPEPINREIFTGARSTTIADELDEALQSPTQLNRAIRDIQKYVLARIDHRANTLQIHRLVQAVLQSRMPADQHGVMEHGAHVLLAGAGKPGEPSDSDQWLRYQALASHITASNAVACADDWARELVINLVEFYFRWGDYVSGRELVQRVVEEWRGRLGPDHRQTLQAAKWLGYYLWVEGEYEAAADIQSDTLGRYERTFGRDDEGTIDAMGMVSATLRTSGRFAAARDLDLDAFQRSRRVLGEDDPVTLRMAHTLGVSLRLTGEFRTARQLDADTYRRRVAVLGDDHPETLRTLNNLTIDERECGEYMKSKQVVERIYTRYVSLFGIGHPETIRVARNLAVARRRAGDHENAYKLAEDTMNRFRDRFGTAHPDAIAATLNFAVDVRERDEVARAQVLAAETVDAYHSALGADHPYTLYARTNLGIVLRLLGRIDEARAHNQAAWETLERQLGPNHVLTLTCGINLASDRYAQSDHQGAYDLDLEVLRRWRQVMGAEHPSTLACQLNLSFDLLALDRTAEGEAVFNETMQAYVRVLSEDHPAIRAAQARARANCDVDPMQF
jgi:tetratricopeptide (TPR) repeat protein